MIYEFHRYANIFPMANNDDFSRLVDDIKKNGLLEPIWLHEGKILDGRNRYNACKQVDVNPKFREYIGGDALSFVLSLNLARRHLNSSKCAIIAAKVKEHYAEEAKKRQIEAGKQHGRGQEKLPQKFAEAISKEENEAAQKAADAIGNTNRDYVRKASKLVKEAPEVAELIMQDKANIPDAVEITKLEPEQRKQVIDKVNEGKKAKDAIKLTQASVMHSSESNEWYTPEQYIKLAHELMGAIDLDPASCEQANQTVKAHDIYTANDNGFDTEWHGRVWLNPPYGKSEQGSNQAIWSKKLIDEYQAGRVTEGLLLVNSATGNKWFSSLWQFPICFVNHRIRFVSPSNEKSQPTHSNVIVYLGHQRGRFIKLFSEIGVVAGRLPA